MKGALCFKSRLDHVTLSVAKGLGRCAHPSADEPLPRFFGPLGLRMTVLRQGTFKGEEKRPQHSRYSRCLQPAAILFFFIFIRDSELRLHRRRRSTFVDAPDMIGIEMTGHPAAIG